MIRRIARWRLLAFVAAGAGLSLAVGYLAHAKRRPAFVDPTTHDPRRVELHVPRAAGPIVLDGDMDDPGWAKELGRTGAFQLDHAPARPYSDARFVWGDDHLYVALYAADEDIRASQHEADSPLWLEDTFHLTFGSGAGERTFDVSPLGVLTDAMSRADGTFDYTWQSGAHVSHEIDGTLNDSTDDDEEWVIEMAIPLEALGLRGERGERLAFSAKRCDTPHKGARVCATWGDGEAPGVLVLD